MYKYFYYYYYYYYFYYYYVQSASQVVTRPVDPKIDRVELDDRSTATGDQLDRSTQLLTLLSARLSSMAIDSIDFIDSVVDSLGLLHVAWPEWCALFVVLLHVLEFCMSLSSECHF